MLGGILFILILNFQLLASYFGYMPELLLWEWWKTAATAAIVMLPSSHINDFNLQITFYAFFSSFIYYDSFYFTRFTILILHKHITEDTSQCLLIVKDLCCAFFSAFYVVWTILKLYEWIGAIKSIWSWKFNWIWSFLKLNI